MLYVNALGPHLGDRAATGKVRWKRNGRRIEALDPGDRRCAIARRLQGRNPDALDRSRGRPVVAVAVSSGKVESSPVVVEGTHIRRPRRAALRGPPKSGRVRWAYDTGGRINASPSVYGGRVCITTYAGSIFCLTARTGEEIWSTYVRRDAFRYESFYSSPSTDGAAAVHGLPLRERRRARRNRRRHRVVARRSAAGATRHLRSPRLGSSSARSTEACGPSSRGPVVSSGRPMSVDTDTRRAGRDRPVRVRLDAGEADVRLAVEDGRIVGGCGSGGTRR